MGQSKDSTRTSCRRIQLLRRGSKEKNVEEKEADKEKINRNT
jgi:hypothetical protein